jgi:asparagine synthase (glutamine-hydrolysing)
MCGIGGILTTRAELFPRGAVEAMSLALKHRGPDDQGFLQWDGRHEPQRNREIALGDQTCFALIHRRLSIIDLSQAGWQPMTSHNGQFDVIFNGEIYNYLELRNELKRAGITFRSASDTEVLLAAWALWGQAALQRFTGMYAIALIDWRARKLTLVRDCFGIKPLYYARWNGGLAFASEAKALLQLPDVSRTVSSSGAYRYLALGLTDDGGDTLFSDIRQVPPACSVEIDLNTTIASEPRRYWRLPDAASGGPSFVDAAVRLRDLFVDSVRLHLRSDVPLGVMLSGGIDSSAILMAMRTIGGDKADLHTFTYVADDPALDEERWADLAGNAAHATMHKVRITSQELVNDLDRLIADQDFPFGSTSIYAQHRVFGMARAAGIKVVLSGQGADEMLAGYHPYRAARLASLVRSGKLVEAFTMFQQAKRVGGSAGRTALRVMAGLVPATFMQAGYDSYQRISGQDAVNRGWFSSRGIAGDGGLWRGRSSLRDALAVTFSETNLPALLRYEDRNSMAHSLESRVPFLNRSLVDFVFSLPEHYLIAPDGSGKSILRAALRGLVPDAILDRRDKIGFQTPELGWLSHLDRWVTGVLTSDAARENPVIHADVALAQWGAVREGRRRFDSRIWRWLNLIRWSESMNARFA